MFTRAAYLIVFIALSIGNAHGFCSSPSFYEAMPDPPSSYERPNVPYCLSGYSYTREHTCSEWELDSYFDDVDEYIEDLQKYYSDVVDFANSAALHADYALRYAKCEAEEVSTQHE